MTSRLTKDYIRAVHLPLWMHYSKLYRHFRKQLVEWHKKTATYTRNHVKMQAAVMVSGHGVLAWLIYVSLHAHRHTCSEKSLPVSIRSSSHPSHRHKGRHVKDSHVRSPAIAHLTLAPASLLPVSSLPGQQTKHGQAPALWYHTGLFQFEETVSETFRGLSVAWGLGLDYLIKYLVRKGFLL